MATSPVERDLGSLLVPYCDHDPEKERHSYASIVDFQ